MLDDTIVAISTPVGEGGIGIVRLSGSDALTIADKIFRPKDGKTMSGFRSYTTHYGHIVQPPHPSPLPLTSTMSRGEGIKKSSLSPRPAERDPAMRESGERGAKPPRKGIGVRGEVIDEVILTVMKAPKSYTKEDIVEINCHGGMVPLKRVLEITLSLGARLAEPGEFTKRAFLNGRIDLAQAESVLDIIKSKTDAGLRAAMSGLKGEFSARIKCLRENLIDLLSRIEASIDFPDEEIETLSECGLTEGIKDALKELTHLIETADRGRILMEGIRAVICGRTNVGKSSLMNHLLRQNRVIVSPIPGTTRDVIEEMINIDGIPIKVIDTAGITNSDDTLTRESVRRSRSNIGSADLVLFMLDASAPLSDGDRMIAEEIGEKKTIIIINKIDLPRNLGADELRDIAAGRRVIEISVTKNMNIEGLERTISETAWGGEIFSDHTVMATNARHKNLLSKTKEALERALQDAADKVPSEFITLDMKEAIDSLGGITGETIDGEVLERIFNNFCIGK